MTFNRQKTVRPQALNGSTVLRLSVLAQLLYLKLGHFADDYGKESANTTMLRGAMFPRNPEVTDDLLEQSLVELADAGLAQLYSLDGEEYFLLTKWALHWKVDAPSKSDIPSPPSDPDPTLSRPSRDSPETLAAEGGGGEGVRGGVREGASAAGAGTGQGEADQLPTDPASLGLRLNSRGFLVDWEGVPSQFCAQHQPMGVPGNCRHCAGQRRAHEAHEKTSKRSTPTGPRFEPEDD